MTRLIKSRPLRQLSETTPGEAFRKNCKEDNWDANQVEMWMKESERRTEEYRGNLKGF